MQIYEIKKVARGLKYGHLGFHFIFNIDIINSYFEFSLIPCVS